MAFTCYSYVHIFPDLDYIAITQYVNFFITANSSATYQADLKYTYYYIIVDYDIYTYILWFGSRP